MPDEKSKGMNRKGFFWKLGGASMGMAAGGGVVHTMQFLTPKVLFEPPTRFAVGQPEDFSPGSVTTKSIQKLYIVRAAKGYYYAMSNICSHLGCITNFRETDKLISCPCHGSTFDLEGNVLDGPAPRPLQRFFLERNDRGQLIVDEGQAVDQNFILKV